MVDLAWPVAPRVRARRRTPDAAAVRVVAVARVLVLITVAAIGSFRGPQHGRNGALLVIIGLVAVPWATVVLFAADRRDNRLAVYGGPLGDLATLFAIQAMATVTTDAVLPGYLALTAFAVYTGGRRFGGWVIAGAVSLTLLAHALRPHDVTLPVETTTAFAAGILAVLFLVERTTALQARAAASSASFRDRADTIVAHVADAVFVTDDHGQLILANPATERLVGRAAREIDGSACHAMLGLYVGERALDCSRGCPLVRTGETEAASWEVWRQDPAGRRQPLLADAAPVAGADGGVEVVHSLRDITRLKQAEEAKTLFLATASHELKTPLTVISGFASTLLRYPDLDAATRESALSAIQTRAGELTRIVERLLLSSRIEAGKVELDLAPVPIDALLRERVAACSAAMSRAITFDAADSLPEAEANTDALTTVIDHLLDNAIKYSPGGEDIDVSISADESTVTVMVRDHGIGMDAEQAQHCFDRFWQAESTDVRRFGGTGIGLYIVQSLIHTMGGAIGVTSSPGEGTTFTVRLRRVGSIPQQRQPGRGEATSIREFMRQIGVAQVGPTEVNPS